MAALLCELEKDLQSELEGARIKEKEDLPGSGFYAMYHNEERTRDTGAQLSDTDTTAIIEFTDQSRATIAASSLLPLKPFSLTTTQSTGYKHSKLKLTHWWCLECHFTNLKHDTIDYSTVLVLVLYCVAYNPSIHTL